MASKPTRRVEFEMFHVVYEDGSQRSNRRVPRDLMNGLDGGEDAVRLHLEQQDREIAAKSGLPPLAIKSLRRAGK
jgi:hypothetical protein